MKVKDLIKVLLTIENQDAEVLMYNGDYEGSFQNIDFVNKYNETVILNDQYNSKRFIKEGDIIPVTNILLTEKNIQEITTEGDTKVVKLQGLNPLELGFLKPGELEIRFIDNSICVINKSKDNSYYESKYAYCIFNKESLDFIEKYR